MNNRELKARIANHVAVITGSKSWTVTVTPAGRWSTLEGETGRWWIAGRQVRARRSNAL